MTWHGVQWPGASVVILASGPSLTVEQCELVRAWREREPATRKVIAINTTFRRAPWADLLYACDWQWWNAYHAEVKAIFQGELWTQDERAQKQFGLRWIKSEWRPGLSRTPGMIHQGRNGGYQAIGLAHQAGAKRIVLLGYDMTGGHHHGEHPVGVRRASNYSDWIPLFVPLAEDLKADGVDVINCTPSTALTAFRQATLEKTLAE